ncbi:hypothetical protein HY627_02070 [Candidatus Uhrbacteria bacterium]|nr:hypothetical protein [Candidatus Uhrbacteria bacterium]
MGTFNAPVVGNVEVTVGGVVSTAKAWPGKEKPLNNKKVTVKTVTALKIFLETKNE